MSRRSLSLLALVAVATFPLGCARKATEAAVPPPERIASVRTERLTPRAVADVASLPADLLPFRRAVLAAEVPGVVESFAVQEGQSVAAGELLLAIDTRALAQSVAEAEALARQTDAQYERAQNLFERRSITKQQFLDATTNRDVNRARLASARLQFEKSRVKAPWAGRIAAKRAEIGDFVQPGQPVAELVDLSRLKVRAPARAVDAPYLEVGREVTLKVDAFPDLALAGRVARLGAELDPQSRTLAVEVEIANPQGRLRPGLPARMELPRQTLPAALVVPLAALVDFENEKSVYVVADGRASRRRVELGPVVGSEVVVTSGLAAGERVVIEGQQQVSDGQRVEEGEEG